MTAKRLSVALPLAALLLLAGTVRGQFPSGSRPYDPFARPAGGGYYGGTAGQHPGPWTGMGPGVPSVPNPVAYPNQWGGQRGARTTTTYHRNVVVPGRLTRDDRDRSGVSPELAGKLAEGVASGLSHSGHSSGSPRTTLPQTSFSPPRGQGASWWKGATSSSSGKGWLAGIGAGIAAAFAALFGRRKKE